VKSIAVTFVAIEKLTAVLANEEANHVFEVKIPETV
jgi:hypothetical protein